MTDLIRRAAPVLAAAAMLVGCGKVPNTPQPAGVSVSEPVGGARQQIAIHVADMGKRLKLM